MSGRILLIDDDQNFSYAMGKALRRRGFQVEALHNGETALRAIARGAFDAALLDLRMADIDGLSVLRRSQPLSKPVIMLTGHGGVPEAVEAMSLGAYSFVNKPIDAEELTPLLKQALAAHQQPSVELVTESQSMRSLSALIVPIARSNEPPLLIGEAGVGKETIARFIHQESALGARPFMMLKLRSIEEAERSERIQSALCALQQGHSGALYLDELRLIPLEQQERLLRYLDAAPGTRGQQRGRLFFGSQEAPHSLHSRGEIEERLCARIQVFPLYIKPFRERPEDAIALLLAWVERLSGFKAELLESERILLENQPWLGNGREVIVLARRLALFIDHRGRLAEGMLARLLALTGQPVVGEASSSAVREATIEQKNAPPSLPRTGTDMSLDALERAHISSLLKKHKNVSLVSKILGINRRTLQRKMKAWGEEP